MCSVLQHICCSVVGACMGTPYGYRVQQHLTDNVLRHFPFFKGTNVINKRVLQLIRRIWGCVVGAIHPLTPCLHGVQLHGAMACYIDVPQPPMTQNSMPPHRIELRTSRTSVLRSPS